MGKAKKAKNAKMSQDRLNLKARAAAGAAATAGRARTFADKQDKLAKAGADPEIAEGLEEYEDGKKKAMTIAEFIEKLPNPKDRGAAEYSALHEYIETLGSCENENPMVLLEASLDEMFSYVVSIRECARNINRGQKVNWDKI